MPGICRRLPLAARVSPLDQFIVPRIQHGPRFRGQGHCAVRELVQGFEPVIVSPAHLVGDGFFRAQLAAHAEVREQKPGGKAVSDQSRVLHDVFTDNGLHQSKN